MNKYLGSILFAALLVTFGVAAGFYAARQGVEAGAEDEAAAGPNELSEQTLKNLGVTVGEAKLTEFVRTVKVQAVVEDPPRNTRRLSALLGGVVTSIHLPTGAIAKAGEPIATLARAPIARPKLELTKEIVAPVSEGLHASVAKLRSATAQAQIAEREFKRLKSYSGDELPIIPRKELIELEYEVARTKQEKENAEHELSWHGLSPAEIESVRKGGTPPPSPQLWRRALKKNSLWGEVEDSIFEALSADQQRRPWSVAVIGELSAAGLATPELARAMRKEPEFRDHFIEAASLVLEGYSVASVVLLARHGSLNPEMILRAPEGDWDVAQINVRVGEKVAAGSTVALLYDARSMWLQLEPVGKEVAYVAAALQRGVAIRGRPLVAGSGPILEGLRVERFETRSEEEARGAAGIAVAKNEAQLAPDGRSRTWRLRVGLRYLVEVPVAAPARRFVLPASAITDYGADRVVYVRDGSTFRDVSVHVEYLDDEIAVIANDGAIFEGDPVVLTAAFALGLALQQESGAVDPHAGHNH
ncbi:MAG: efflux RND transporter periplasmic adaptor subunit [Planctomycetota bacterium]|jgi:multidrug efflux pump subunit AcrA (membrane-fusion protein)